MAVSLQQFDVCSNAGLVSTTRTQLTRFSAAATANFHMTWVGLRIADKHRPIILHLITNA